MYSAIKGVSNVISFENAREIKNRFINVTSFLNFTSNNSKRVTTSPDYQGDLISYHSTYVKKVYNMLRILNNCLRLSHGMPTSANKTLKTRIMGVWNSAISWRCLSLFRILSVIIIIIIMIYCPKWKIRNGKSFLEILFAQFDRGPGSHWAAPGRRCSIPFKCWAPKQGSSNSHLVTSFGMTRPGIEPTTSRLWGGRSTDWANTHRCDCPTISHCYQQFYHVTRRCKLVNILENKREEQISKFV